MKKLLTKTLRSFILTFLIFSTISCGVKFTGEQNQKYYFKYDNPIYLDIENLYRNRTIFVFTVNFSSEFKTAIEEELQKVNMAVVKDPRLASFSLNLFLREVSSEQIIMDILIREKPEIKGFEGKTKYYSSDIDSTDHITTLRFERTSNDNETYRRIAKHIAEYFKLNK